MSETVDVLPFIKEEDGSHLLHVMVEGANCMGCVQKIERAFKKQKEICEARLNLSTRRLKIIWNGEVALGNQWIRLLEELGYRAVPFEPANALAAEKKQERFLLKCLAVAGFSSGNLMLFSIPLWTADNTEMGEATRSFFQWIQAFIAMPTIAYAGQPFFRSAIGALKKRTTNMDVPISVAVILATLMSVFEVLTHGQHAYFDSAVMLLFFLLIGRFLDARVRGKARGAAHDLLQMMQWVTTVLHSDGRQETLPMSSLTEGMVMLISAGEKMGADGEVIEGESEIDNSLITGETLPQKISRGGQVFAGTINLLLPLKIRVTRPGERSLLAEIIRLMEHAEQSQARYVAIADKIARWYTPLVHFLAAITFLGWWSVGGILWQEALLYAATVLIITCPCALGLAVPVVQVLASSRLMQQGILIKSGSALERLAKVTHIAFDKTGTLTEGRPLLLHQAQYHEETLKLAASLAAHSKHPLSRALCKAYHGPLLSMTVKEVPGFGLEAEHEGEVIRLGRRSWCGITALSEDNSLELWLRRGEETPLRFMFADQLREDARAVIAALKQAGFTLMLLSGDREEVVAKTAEALEIETYKAAISPTEKCHQLESWKKAGAKVLMVGDGLNDAPSLSVADISMSPSSAMDITQNAADIVFQGERLSPVLTSLKMAKFSQKLVKENFLLAMLYNAIAVPLAIAGLVTPLIAAIAMSGSSLLVIANAMRIAGRKGKR